MGQASSAERVRTHVGRAAGPLSTVSALAFAGLSAARRKRVFHPRGETYAGRVQLAETSSGLPFQGTYDAVIRFSRGVGLPQSWPDVLGIAIKLPEAGQDILLASSGEGTLTRHLLIPSTGFFRRPYSTVLPYDLDGRLVVFGAVANAALRDAGRQEMDDLGAYVANGKLRFELTLARAGEAEAERIGVLVVDHAFDGDAKFNPWHTHPRLRPAGTLNRMRRESYETSQAARPDEAAATEEATSPDTAPLASRSSG